MRYVKILVCTATMIPGVTSAASLQWSQPSPSPQRTIIQAPAPVVTRQAPVIQPQTNQPTYTFSTMQNGNVQIYQNGRLISTGTAGYAQQYGYRGPATSPASTTPTQHTVLPAATPTFSPQFQPVAGATTPTTINTVGTVPPSTAGRLQFTPVTQSPVTNQNTALSVTQSGSKSSRSKCEDEF